MEFAVGLMIGGVGVGVVAVKWNSLIEAAHSLLAKAESKIRAKMAARAASLISKS